MLLLLTTKSRNKDYKLVTGKLREHFGFKLDDDNKVTDGEKVYCFHCDKGFVFRGSNTSMTYHLQHTHPTALTEQHCDFH